MHNLLVIFRKDFIEVLRERRSLIFMFILPTIVVPLLVITINFLTQETIEKATGARIKIGLIGTHNLPEEIRLFMLANRMPEEIRSGRDLEDHHTLVQGLLLWSPEQDPDILFNGRQLLQLDGNPAYFDKFQFIDRGTDWENIIQPFQIYGSSFLQDQIETNNDAILGEAFINTIKDIRSSIENKEFHAIVIIPPDFSEALRTGRNVRFHVISDTQEFRSSSGASSFVRLMRFALTWLAYFQLERQSLDISLLKPLNVEQYSVNPKTSLYMRLLPYFMVLMCFIGALYPAIDLVAGEKERNTLETILICPVSRFDILIGKFLVIFLSGFISSLLTYLSLSLTLAGGLTGGELQIRDIFSPTAIFNYLIMLVPLAALFAALLLTLSTVARNFKEAQSYIMPFNFLVLIPAFYALLPGVELGVGAAMIPVLNATLALRDIWAGEIQGHIIFLVMGSSTLYSLLLIGLCTWLFRKESILFRT